jgi:branched-chain amino acid transport system ATP-binding protein
LALLELNEVTMKFGALIANDRVSFTVEAGSIVGLIGPNGAGKTTLFRLHLPGSTSRSADAFPSMGGYNRTHAVSDRPQRGGAHLPGCPALKEMTVFDNVLVGAFLKCHDNRRHLKKPQECIGYASLPNIQDKLAGGLPIAGKKRLEMARALAAGPSCSCSTR